MALTITAVTATTSSSNVTSYASSAFTPAANDLLVVLVTASGTVEASPTLTDSQGLGFTLVATALKNSSADKMFVFVANNLAANSSMTVTFGCPDDAATGCIIQIVRIAGSLRQGLSAIRQSATTPNHASGSAPAFTFGTAALTGNAVIGFAGNSTSPAGLTPPTGSSPTWTEGSDVGYSTPTTGAEYVYANSGFTGTTLTWGATTASAYGVIGIEVNASAYPSFTADAVLLETVSNSFSVDADLNKTFALPVDAFLARGFRAAAILLAHVAPGGPAFEADAFQ